MTTYSVVTTCNANGWNNYGERMVESFRARWPGEVTLTIYPEEFEPVIGGRIHSAQFPRWLHDFKERHKKHRAAHGYPNGVYDYRLDCVRFAHKVAAVTDHLLSTPADVGIWLDADTFTHATVTKEWLENLFPPVSPLAWLDRLNCYPECGFVMYRRCDQTAELIGLLQEIYMTDRVFALKETHDSFVLEWLVNSQIGLGRMYPPHSLSGAARRWSHPFINSEIGKCLDHFKGERKRLLRTPKQEQQTHRGVDYWRR